MKGCSTREMKKGTLLIMLLSRCKSKNQHSGGQVFWQTLVTPHLMMNKEREKQEQWYRIYGKVREGKYSEVSEKVCSSKNGDGIYLRIYKDEDPEVFFLRGNSHSRKLRVYDIEIENHKEWIDWDRKKIHV